VDRSCCKRRLLPLPALGGAALVFLSLVASGAALGAEPEPLPRAALVSGSPVPPSPAGLAVLHQKLGTGYRLVEDPVLRRELEVLDHGPSAEQIVADVLKDALQRMRRLALEEVQRVLEEAEPHVRRLPPTPGGRALLCTVAIRRAHVALLLGDTATATEAIQRGLSAAPDFTLDQALEPPPLVELFERVRKAIHDAPRARLRVRSVPPGALVVMGETPLGRAPLQIEVPADTAVTLFAVQDGHSPRNVTAKADATADASLSVDINLEAQPETQGLRPLLEALRTMPEAREHTARALARILRVDAVILAQAGLRGRPDLLIYGAPPRWPALSQVPGSLDITVLPLSPGRKRHLLPPWLWGVLGAAAGAALTTGIILGATR
jgi:hypothetical protein